MKAPVRRKLLAYPFAFGAFFVMALAAENEAALLDPFDLIRPLLVVLVVSLLGWIVSQWVASPADKTAILAALWVIGFSIYGYVYEALRGPALGESTLLHGALLAWVAAAWILLARALRRSASTWAGTTRYCNVLAVILVAQAALRLGYAVLTSRPYASPPAVAALVHRAEPRTVAPDIYLLVLDKYSGSRYLKSLYDLDNTPFESQLRARGFVVPRESRTNYVQTFLSLASMLNARYLDDVPRQIGEANRRWAAVYPLVEHSTVAEFLQTRGYRFVFFPTAFPATNRNRTADLQLPDPRHVTREFVVGWERTTMLPALHHLWCLARHCTTNRWPYVPESATFFDWKFEQIGRIGGDSRPVFVLAHLLVPHEPYLYRGDCTHREPIWPPSDGGVFAPVAAAAYAEQVTCVNTKVLSLVDSILRRSRLPPVILIQADHGHGRFGRLVPPLDSVSTEQASERASVFAAYYLPGVAPTVVVDSISPVNAIRLVLRHYFGADLPPVEDATYWSSWNLPYRFERITVHDMIAGP